MDRVVLSWSGGKDAAYALDRLRAAEVEVVGLLTTVDGGYDRSTMHGVRRELYDRQADAIGLPLNQVVLPHEPSNDEYAATMAAELARYRERAVEAVAFGDLFLEDVRDYRQERLAEAGMTGRFPLWGMDTRAVATAVLDLGVSATVVAVDGDALDASFAGRPYDEGFLSDLPDGVDPCGERGEFHTFVHDAPYFDAPLPVAVGEVVTRSLEGGEYHYADLRLERATAR